MFELGVVMDAIHTIKPYKDSTFAMLLAAQQRGCRLWHITLNDLFMRDGRVFAQMSELQVYDDKQHWFSFGQTQARPLAELDVVLMRKDPPFDIEYIVSTYLLERAEAEGVLVVNRPQSLRDANEKMFTAWFPQCCVPTLVTRQITQIRAFLQEHQTVIVKPLDTMGGSSIFKLTLTDENTAVILETVTQQQQRYVMVQRFIPEIKAGDKRILLIDGQPIPYALARVPQGDDFRGNLAVGGKGVGVELSERDRWICQQVGETLRAKGLLFVGLDVIGDYLTEINVTSPTGIRELTKIYNIDIAGQFIDCLAAKVHKKH